jgi:peptidyl-tRNA hydrolase
LYVITHAELDYGRQAAQIVHAVMDYCSKHPFQEWMEVSNYVVVLCAKNENHLNEIMNKALENELLVGFFQEPDLDNQLTAIVLEPCKKSKQLCSSLPLLKG